MCVYIYIYIYLLTHRYKSTEPPAALCQEPENLSGADSAPLPGASSVPSWCHEEDRETNAEKASVGRSAQRGMATEGCVTWEPQNSFGWLQVYCRAMLITVVDAFLTTCSKEINSLTLAANQNESPSPLTAVTAQRALLPSNRVTRSLNPSIAAEAHGLDLTSLQRDLGAAYVGGVLVRLLRRM